VRRINRHGGLNVHVDLTGGPLGPGATPEPTDEISEIEIKLKVGPGGDDYDAIYINGGDLGETFRLGATGLSLNDDADPDVDLGNDFENLRVRLIGGAGADSMTGMCCDGGPNVTGFDMFGGAGTDTLVGGLGGDRIEGEAGADSIDGGKPPGEQASYTPYDVIGFGASPVGVVVDLSAGTATGGDADGDVYVRIDSVFGTAFDDVLRGDEGMNALLSGMGSDTLEGRGGDDYLEGEAGPDALNGGDGFDSINHNGSGAPLLADLGAGTVSGGYANGDTIENIEAVNGSPNNDRIVGDAGPNALTGGEGNDVLIGKEGDDFLSGDSGSDEANGGGGNDYISMNSNRDAADVADGGEGDDYVDYYGRQGPVAMSSDGIANDGASGENDNLISIEGFGASDSDDLLSGGNHDDAMRGRGGDDELSGGGGKDKLLGDTDDDQVDGGGGEDRVKGGDGSDDLSGSGGNDIIDGGAGRDVIDGGPGKDICYITKGDKTKDCEKLEHRLAH
jgi:Ca2+-binding RTX toxin-like protein